MSELWCRFMSVFGAEEYSITHVWEIIKFVSGHLSPHLYRCHRLSYTPGSSPSLVPMLAFAAIVSAAKKRRKVGQVRYDPIRPEETRSNTSHLSSWLVTAVQFSFTDFNLISIVHERMRAWYAHLFLYSVRGKPCWLRERIVSHVHFFLYCVRAKSKTERNESASDIHSCSSVRKQHNLIEKTTPCTHTFVVQDT